MDVQRKRISHDLISNLFYYLFLVLILLVTILSFTLDEIDLLINILTISLIVTSLVLIFYIAVQMLRYNFTIEKKIQLGILLVVIGFILVLTSFSKQISFGDYALLQLLEDTVFVYWGIGVIVLGVFVELTLLDQWLWKISITPLKYLWRLSISFFKFLRKHWKTITLYILDLISIAAIIYFSIGTCYFSIIFIAVGSIYLIVHHAKRIWKAIKYIAVNIFYRLFVNIYNGFISLVKSVYRGFINLLKSIYNGIVSLMNAISEFIKKYWRQIIYEFIRLIFLVAGIIIMMGFIFPMKPLYFWLQFSSGIVIMIFAELLSRKRVWRFIFKHKKGTTRFLGMCLATISLVRTYYYDVGWDGIDISFFIIGLFVIAFARFIVDPIAVLEFFKKVFIEIGLFFSRAFKFIWTSIKDIVTRIWIFFKAHYKTILLEISRLVIAGVTIFLILRIYIPIWAGIIIIVFVEIIIRKTILKSFYNILKRIYEFFKNLLWVVWNFFKEHYKRILAELARLIVCAAGIFFIVWGWRGLSFLNLTNFNEQNFIWLGFALIVLTQFILRKFLLKPLYEFLENLALFVWEILKILFYKPIRFIALKTYTLLKFLVEHWFKVILYSLDFAAIVSIIYFSIKWNLLEWYSIIIIAGSGIYLLGHHYLSIWKAIRFIAVDIFYKFFYNIYKFFKAILIGIKNAIVRLFKFIADHWWIILKEFFRLLGVAAGIYLIFHGYVNAPIDTERIYTIIGIILIPFSLIFTRLVVWRRIYNALKRFSKWIVNVFETIWLTLKTLAHYIFTNFLRLMLLLFMIFTFICGIALIARFDFWGLIVLESYPYYLSIGGILIVVAIGSLFLFRRQLGKLRTGESRILFREIMEAWKK